MRTRNLKKQNFHVCKLSQSFDNGRIVQNDLAITPSDVKALTLRGMSVNTPNVAVVHDPESSSYLPLEFQRGTDINVAWESSQSYRQTLIDNYKLSKL